MAPYNLANTMSRLQDALTGALYRVLNNEAVVAIVVAIIGLAFPIAMVLDHMFHTSFRAALVNRIRDITRDDLSTIRKAQIRYLFRRHYNLKNIRIRLAGGSYWMSIPCIIEGVGRKTRTPRKYMGKIINGRSAMKHRYMTILRRIGVLAEGAKLDFMDHMDAEDMVAFERDWMVLLRSKGIRVPNVYGVHRLNHDDYILVMEFIDGQPLSKVEINEDIVDQIFAILKIMHETGVFHGDMKLDNLLYYHGRIYVIDCLKINPDDSLRAHQFDLICIILALAQRMPVDTILAIAARYHPGEELADTTQYMGIAMKKADLDLPPEKISEIRRSLGALKTAA
jgi:hypothetical protein